MTDDDKPDLNASSDELWNTVKNTMESIFDREITTQEFYYLLSLYPYLEICDANYPYLDEGVTPTLITLDNGWRIFDFKSVLISGHYELFTRPAPRQPSEGEVEGGEDGPLVTGGGGHGTLVKQFSDVAFDMIALAIKKGWKAAEIISGFYPMQRMAWIAADEKTFELKGFDPTPEDYVVQNWVGKIRQRTLYPPKIPIIPGGDKGLKRT